MQLYPSVRPSDLVNSHTAAPLEWVETVVALDRIHLSNVQAHDWGYKLRLSWSARFSKWWFERADVRSLFLLHATELDRYGTHLLIGRPPGSCSVSPYTAICPWTALPQAAEELRTTHIGAEFWDSVRDKETVLAAYAADITTALELPEAPLNTRELPAVCHLKWGVLLRLGPEQIERALDYLAVEKPLDCSVPLKVDLGAYCFTVCAFSPSPKEPLRLGLVRNWNVDLATKDASRWLRSFQPRPCEKEKGTFAL
jgi:hypothetical protein